MRRGLSVGWILRRFDLMVCWSGRKVAVKPGVFIGIWMRDSTGWIVGCRAEFVLIDLGVINDWYWNASKAGVLSVLDGWLETQLSLFVRGHAGMVG